ncbi:hypothetical protein [Novacetimonas pomaceti]|uniref:Uncharacterized protein n=1 Tax=Novacetimonas pomaceti TaxID=2021998 RepID=A0ABX5P0E2_9PROT|nr:hypothetical protein [Novacetimonas pomaceti]PYD46664.1 hypothetical protein C3920_13980 [Novacetimonas pomaceti]
MRGHGIPRGERSPRNPTTQHPARRDRHAPTTRYEIGTRTGTPRPAAARRTRLAGYEHAASFSGRNVRHRDAMTDAVITKSSF